MQTKNTEVPVGARKAKYVDPFPRGTRSHFWFRAKRRPQGQFFCRRWSRPYQIPKFKFQASGRGAPSVVDSNRFMPGGQKVADVAIEELVSGRNDPVMSSGSVWWSPMTIFCNGCSGSSICRPLAIEEVANAHPASQAGAGVARASSSVPGTAQMVDGRIAFGETHLFCRPRLVVRPNSIALKTAAWRSSVAHGQE